MVGVLIIGYLLFQFLYLSILSYANYSEYNIIYQGHYKDSEEYSRDFIHVVCWPVTDRRRF